MKIFVAGATGTLGRPLVRQLIARGHELVGLTRTPAGVRALEAMGVRGVIGDAMDAERMRSAILDARPEQVIHLLTALPAGGAPRPRGLRPTNRLRIVGTANLLRGSIEAGVRRMVAESFAGVYGAATFTHRATEREPLPPAGNGAFREGALALRSMEDQLRTARDTRQMETVALRIGFLYGPEAPATRMLIQQARAGWLFAPRGLTGLSPFVHIDDAISAIIAAIEKPSPSVSYNVVDDEPVKLESFLDLLVQAAGARRVKRAPGWLVRLTAPLLVDLLSARLLLSNAAAKQELGWRLRYPTIREGLQTLRGAIQEAA